METAEISASSQPRTSPRAPLAVERRPWSQLGPEFIRIWGRPRGKNEPEHLEILGPTGSGKGVLLRDILLERARRRETNVVFICTKSADKTTASMNWPITDTWRGVTEHEQVIFWPRTARKGLDRQRYQAAKIQDLLDNLWEPEANTVVVFDEFLYVESLTPNLKATLGMYLREGRSHGICCVMGKQRVQGVQRDMHSESDWKFSFKMNDDDDNERLAQLFGNKREMLPVVNSLNREKFEFLVQHKLTGATYISWVDKPVRAPAHPDGYRK
jgi:hypothetical protein